LKKVYSSIEKEKKRHYCDRILQVEHGTFTPLVFSSNGGMGREASCALKQLANLISSSSGEAYSQTMGLLRCRFAFCLMRCAVTCLRGSRRLRSNIFLEESTTLINWVAGIQE
jgi:hypothetical protein